MTGPCAQLLPDGKRLHLQHGPIDLIIGADGERSAAFAAAQRRFAGLLEELVEELPLLRTRLTAQTPLPAGHVAQRMHRSTHPFCIDHFITPMAAVAGSVADTILSAMVAQAKLKRAYVNNGGDIALHLAPGTQFTTAIADLSGRDLGRITIRHEDPVRGIATSGRHGRSLSLGIADSVTVLARSAASADAAATLIANAVDQPGHPGIRRCPASDIADDSDLGELPIVTHCAPLHPSDIDAALSAGLRRAQEFAARGLITAAALTLQSETRATRSPHFQLPQRTPAYA
jgi:ApbE superfamily uncharacterized protein (UPF0280 family)